MSTNVGSLFVSLGLDSAQFDSGLAKAKAGINSLGKINVGKGFKAGLSELDAGFKSTAQNAGFLGTVLSNMGVAGVAAAAGLAAAAGVAVRARQAFDFADDIADTAAKLAVSTTRLQEYRYAIHLLGGEYADADSALDGFQKAFGAAQAKMSAKALKPFKQLGLDPDSFASVDEAFEATIKKISALGSTAQQAAIADKLGMGSILPALREGSDAIDDARAAAHRLGIVMDEDLIQQAGEANDRLQDLEKVVEVQLNSALVGLAPTIIDVATSMADGAKAVRGLTDDLAQLTKWAESSGAASIVSTLAKIAGSAAGQAANPVGAIAKGLRWVVGAGADAVKTEAPKTAPTATAKPSPAKLLDLSGGQGGGGDTAKARAEAGERAIETATREELAARMALTASLERLGELKLQQLDAETKAANRALLRDAAEGKMNAADAQRAITLNNLAAASKRELIERETAEGLAREHAQQSEQIHGYYDRIADITASMAATAAEQNEIERKALVSRQARERDAEKTRLDEQVQRGAIEDSRAREILAAQEDLHAAEESQRARQAKARLDDEELRRTQAGLRLHIDLLSGQAALADTVLERRDAELRILAAQKQLERVELEKIVASTTATDAEKEEARNRLGRLDEMYDVHGKVIKAQLSMEAAYYETSSAIRSMADAFEAHDFVGMLKSMDVAIGNLKKAFAKGGTLDSKISAVAGIVDGIGRAIGGKTGGALSGAASGAMAGFQLGGPVGAGIGAIVGGLAGLFGASKAKKKAQAEEAARKAEAEAQRQAQIAQVAADQNIQLLRLQGKEEEALAAERERVLAGMDASRHAAQKEIWALEDQAAAAEKAADAAAELAAAEKALADKRAQIAEQAADLEIQIMEAAGNAAGAHAARRAKEVAGAEALDPALGALVQKLHATEDAATAAAAAEEARAAAIAGAETAVSDARNVLSAAYDREAGAMREVIDRFKGLASTLADFGRQLRANSLTMASPSAQYAASRMEFLRVSQLVAQRDVNAIGDLQGVSEEFLKVSEDFAPDALTHLKNLAEVKAAVQMGEALAAQQVDQTTQQLDLMTQQVDELLKANENLVSVQGAIASLKSAMTSLASVKSGDPQAISDAQAAEAGRTKDASYLVKDGKFEGYTRAELYSWTTTPYEMPAGMYAAWESLQYLKNAGYKIPGFKLGGVFSNGIVSQPSLFNVAQMGERGPEAIMPLVRGPDGLGVRMLGGANDNAAMAAELRQMRVELNAGLLAIAKNTSASERIMRRWDGDGQPPTRDDAA